MSRFPKHEEEEVHAFWDTQPVLKMATLNNNNNNNNEDNILEGPIETKSLDDVRQTPYNIPATFEWWTPDFNNNDDVTAVFELLHGNYVEDSSNMYRFNYSPDFLRWALQPPGYIPDWHVAVRHKHDKQLLAFISGVPMNIQMGNNNNIKEICEINFLCVHKKLRAKRLAPIMIQEVTRRVNLTNIWQAIYTIGKLLPTPFSSARYFHRSINPEKLCDIGFSRIPLSYHKYSKPMVFLKKHYQLPVKTVIQGLRPMRKGDIDAVYTLLCNNLREYSVAPVFTREEAAHWLLPRKGVLWSYVIESSDNNNNNNTDNNNNNNTGETRVTDFFSFYAIPSSVSGNAKYDNINVAYISYHVATTVDTSTLIGDLLIKARDNNFDVVNCVDILNNRTYLDELKFLPGDGCLHYYFYNWMFKPIPSEQVGLVML